MLERRGSPMLSNRAFARRMAAWVGVTMLVIAGALAIGVVGYHLIAGLPWIDALLNASMILAAMGPVDRVDTDAAKVFASIYALFSGVVFITSISLIMAPIFHRILHHFHLPAEADDDDDAAAKPKPPRKKKA